MTFLFGALGGLVLVTLVSSTGEPVQPRDVIACSLGCAVGSTGSLFASVIYLKLVHTAWDFLQFIVMILGFLPGVAVFAAWSSPLDDGDRASYPSYEMVDPSDPSLIT